MAGTVQTTTKKLGTNALSYSGSDNSAIDTRMNPILKRHKIYTISCWCYWNSFANAAPWGMWAGASVSDEGLISSISSSKFRLAGIASNQSIVVVKDSVSTISTSTWYHIVCEINDTFLKLYINGSLDEVVPSGFQATFANTVDFWTSAQTFRLGGYGPQNLNGYIDEFCILEGALTQTEIDWLYNSGSGNSLL